MTGRLLASTRLLAALAAAALGVTVAAPAMAGDAPVTLNVAYIPIMPMAQLYVIEGEGWAKAAGLNLKLTKFTSGPAIVQAIASGDDDVMYFGAGPALVARAHGVPIKIVAANVVEQIGVVAQGDLAKDAAGTDAAAAIKRFTEEHHRKPKIATLPKGSVPDLVLRYWLTKAGLGTDAVDIVGMGEDKVQQALLTRSVDGASILEPVATIVQQRMKDAKIIVSGSQMFPNQPGAVVAVREGALKTKRDAIEKLVALHIRATELIHKDPARAARDAYRFLGQGLVPESTIAQAIHSPLSHFVSDPRKIIDATKEMASFSKSIGLVSAPVDIEQLFDTSLYAAAAKTAEAAPAQ